MNPPDSTPGNPAAPAAGRWLTLTGRVWWLGLLAACVPLLIYNLLFFNRSFPLTEGWFSVYARLIRAGQVPYRDFYLFLPPLYPLQLAGITAVFGDEFIVLRIVGVLVVLTMTGVLYALFARWFPPFAAAFSVVVAMVYYQSGVAHIGYDFTQFFTLYALLGLYFLVRHCEAEYRPGSSWWQRHRLILLAGFWVACAFLIKQSNGALVVVGALLATAVASWPGGWRRWVDNLLSLGAGMLVPVLLTVAWLACAGALVQAHDQVLHGALQSKGNLGHILFAWAKGLFNRVYVIQLKTIARYLLPPLVIEALLGWFLGRTLRQNLRAPRLNLGFLALLLPLTLAAVLVPYLWAAYAKRVWASAGSSLLNYIIPLSTATSVILALVGLLSSLGRLTLIPPGQMAAAVFSLGLIAGNGTSAGLSEISCFFGLGFLVAWLLSRPADLMIIKVSVVALGCSWVAFLTGQKYASPYAWWYINQPDVHRATRACHLPGLRGMRLAPESIATVTEVVQAIEAYVPRGAPIFCFPHVPQFYLLTDRWPITVAKVHWFDFLPDDKARADGFLLRRTPPAAIICVDLPELAWTAHEYLFRNGAPLGQRDMLRILRELVASKGYTERVSRNLGHGCWLHVWTRDLCQAAKKIARH